MLTALSCTDRHQCTGYALPYSNDNNFISLSFFSSKELGTYFGLLDLLELGFEADWERWTLSMGGGLHLSQPVIQAGAMLNSALQTVHCTLHCKLYTVHYLPTIKTTYCLPHTAVLHNAKCTLPLVLANAQHKHFSLRMA